MNTMSAFVTEIKLRQHTPIIHFQHDQVGATLRATELKPKLDRFIMEQLLMEHRIRYNEYRVINGKTVYVDVPKAFGIAATDPNNTLSSTWTSWLAGRGKAQHTALDYKVHIHASESQDVEIAPPVLGKDGEVELTNGQPPKMKVKTTPLYFGNMGKDPSEIQGLKSGLKSVVKLRIMASKRSLLEYIEDNRILHQFFSVENFGTRQSKGFGCFSLLDENGQNVPPQWPANINPSQFRIDMSRWDTEIDKTISGKPHERPKATDDYRIMKVIEVFYQFLRGGINYAVAQQRLYLKPAIFQYARSLNQQWDKKSVKQAFFNGIRNSQSSGYGNPDVLCYDTSKQAMEGYDFKDLFGFSSEEAWRNTNTLPEYYLGAGQKIEKSFSVQYYDENGNSQSEPELTRFKSPIRFHIMKRDDCRIYDVWFWCAEIPRQYLHCQTTFRKGSTGVRLNLNMFHGFLWSAFFDQIFCQKGRQGYLNALDGFNVQGPQRQAPHYKLLYALCESIKFHLNSNHP